jgi:hypothetical protein
LILEFLKSLKIQAQIDDSRAEGEASDKGQIQSPSLGDEVNSGIGLRSTLARVALPMIVNSSIGFIHHVFPWIWYQIAQI